VTSRARTRRGLPFAAVALLAACGGTGTPSTASSPTRTSATGAPPPAASGTPVRTPASTPGINTRPPGEIDAAAVRDLIVDFDERLAQAYAAGDTGHLDEFLAGSELAGNRATIQLLNSRHQRNIFHVQFDSLTITSSSPQRVVFTLNDHTTDNHFVDTTTNQVINQGYPGPGPQSFTIFFDYNPENHTWYWTGALDNRR
jgi:hypothetical protein